MSTTPNRPGLHPALWVAAASVTAVSLAGVAKLTGLLPDFGAASHPAPEAVVSAPAALPTPPEPVPPTKLAVTEAAEPVATAPAAVEPAPAKAEHREPAPTAKPAPVHRKPAPAVHRTTPAVAQGNPPPADAVPAPQDAPPPGERTARRTVETPPPVCRDCGVIENVEAIQQKGEGSGLGAVGGAILGGVLGHQVGEGSGKQLARIGGAVLGGLAGNEAERRYRTVSHYQITVRLDDGTRRVIEQQSAPAWRVGDTVRIRNGEIQAAPAPTGAHRESPSF